ncbi:MAG TPA: radical SAM protein [Gemmatimonadales bacterium]|nr:radical SAM protein [Gemmatimonadales bacterium]
MTVRPRGLDLLVIQPTALCNLDCRYCYVPDRQNPERLPFPLLEKLLLAVRTSNLAREQSSLKILWHSGEPLAAGIDFFRQAFELTERLIGDRWQIRHAIQTNATLITDAWCELFQAHHVKLGVSLDGPEDVHDANRKTRGGGGSFHRVMRGIERLRAHEIPFGTLSVLTAESIERPDDMFHFFQRNAFRRVAFNVEEIEGPNLRSSLLPVFGGVSSARARYGAFMRRFVELNRDHGWPLIVREFMHLARLIQQQRADPTHVPVAPERRFGGILTVARDGAVSSWSPELASSVPGVPHRFALGNIRDVHWVDELLVTERARTIQEEIDRGSTCAASRVSTSVSAGAVRRATSSMSGGPSRQPKLSNAHCRPRNSSR